MSSESPLSGRVDTRFSTPAPELDDHRFQPMSLPRNEGLPSIEFRRPTPRSESIDPASLLQVNEILRDAQLVSRDFEQVIIDDDRRVGQNETGGAGAGARRLSNREVRLANRQGRPQMQHERANRSRASSTSSSTSPPNSVEAFADPRRRERAGTLDSKAPSFIDVPRRRTLSHGTTRRPTFSNASLVRLETPNVGDDSAEEDVCFPVHEETGKTYKIDYEELEEFVALSAQGKIPATTSDGRRQALSEFQTPKIFHDLRQHQPGAPKTSCNHHDEQRLGKLLSDDSTNKDLSDLDEKVCFGIDFNPKPSGDRFSLFSSEAQSTLHAAELGDLVGSGETFRDLFELGPDGGVWWLDVQNPTKEEVEALSRAFRIHPLTTEDILTQEAREKVELFSQYYFVCFRTFYHEKSSEDFLEPVNIYIVVCREGVLSFCFSENLHAKNVRKRIGKLRDYVSLGSDWICYAMIDDIVDSFGPVIRDAEQESEHIEDQVFIAREDDYISLLRQIGECRKRVLNMMRLLGGKADVIKGFAKRCNEQYSITPRGDIGLYLGDIQDHVVTMMSNLGHVEKMLSRSHGNYLAQLNVDGLMRGNHTNKVLGKITLVATILVPLNLICGLFGMNVNVPGKNAEGLGWFFGIIGVIAAIVVISLAAARRFLYI